jgi:hypothetical protein
MDLKTKYKVKGIGKEETIVSVVEIFTKDGKISEVRDKWDGKDLKEGAFATVSFAAFLAKEKCCVETDRGIGDAEFEFCRGAEVRLGA